MVDKIVDLVMLIPEHARIRDLLTQKLEINIVDGTGQVEQWLFNDIGIKLIDTKFVEKAV